MSVPPQPSNPTVAVFAQVGCSCLALGISLFGLARFDLPITKYVRSVTIHLPWDQLTISWMAFTSNLGDWIGQGWRLAFLSILLLALAWALERPTIKNAAIQTMIAHAIAALLANVLKHLIGRPRPKFVHSGDWQMSFSFVSGLDSFPSGHSTATFAIATVLAKRFPVMSPLCLAIALFVGISRVLRGSHFPTDVMGGAVIGILSGFVAAAPLRQWRTSLRDGLHYAAITASSVLGMLWTLSHQMEEGVTGLVFVLMGILCVVGGVWSRKDRWLKDNDFSQASWQATVSIPLMAFGVAALTTSPLVVASVGCVCVATWLRTRRHVQEPAEQARRWYVIREGAIMGSLGLAIVLLVDARGVLPFQ
ncbi:MAG TPA: phosphatase PAP2 family protein [Nitrospira sp.]|nr:phosphatase PAP2 family protein [Nitrospira sp.]